MSLRLGVIDLEARPGPAAARVRRSLAPSARWPGCLKPLSPLLAGACVGLKPPSPLRMRNRCFWRSFWVQWCWWFQCRHVIAPCARKSSPCTLKTPQNRRFYACWANFFAEEPLEGPYWVNFFAETRLERLCWANFFAETSLEGARRASFSRKRRWRGRAGRVFRGPALVGSRGASCVVPRAWSLGPSTGSVNRLFAFKGVGGVGIRRSGGGSVGGSFGG